MLLSEYQAAAHKTAIYPPELALHYLIPGLLVEALEFQANPSVKEAGDICWFCAEIMTVIGRPMRANEQAHYGVMSHAQELCDGWVKTIRDNGTLAKVWVEVQIEAILGEIQHWAENNGTTLEAVLQANIDKLADRQQRGVLSGSGDER